MKSLKDVRVELDTLLDVSRSYEDFRRGVLIILSGINNTLKEIENKKD